MTEIFILLSETLVEVADSMNYPHSLRPQGVR